jgi:lipopolysaccharide export system protein LptA
MLEGEDMRGVADHATLSQRAQTIVLDGHVILYRGRARLEAERATILFAEHTTIAEGHPAKIISGAAAPPPEATP